MTGSLHLSLNCFLSGGLRLLSSSKMEPLLTAVLYFMSLVLAVDLSLVMKEECLVLAGKYSAFLAV